MAVSRKEREILAQKTLLVLKEEVGDASCTLDFDEPYRFFVRAILSAQCTDKKVNEVCRVLFEKYPEVDDIIDIGADGISEIIKPLGLYKVKAVSVEKASIIYRDEWKREIPKDVNELMKVPGVGKKIANLIVGELYNVPALVVDTHFKRVAKRIGLTDNVDPLKVERDVASLYDDSLLISIGHMMVAYGRTVCKATSPQCGRCKMQDFCKKNI